MASPVPPEAKGFLLPRLEQLLISYQRSRMALGYRIRLRYGEIALDIWVICRLALLFVLALVAGHLWLPALIVSLVALYKVTEVLFSCLSIVFTATIRERGIAHAHRSLFLVLLNVGTIVLALLLQIDGSPLPGRMCSPFAQIINC